MSSTGVIIAGGAAVVGLGLAYEYFKNQTATKQTANASQTPSTSYASPASYTTSVTDVSPVAKTGCNANGQFGTLVGNGADFGSSSAYDVYEQSFSGGYYLSLVDPSTCQLVVKYQHSGSFSIYAQSTSKASPTSYSSSSSTTSSSATTSSSSKSNCVWVNHVCYASWYDYHLAMQKAQLEASATERAKTSAEYAQYNSASKNQAVFHYVITPPSTTTNRNQYILDIAQQYQ